MAALLMSPRCCRASKVMDAFLSSWLFQHSMQLQPFHASSFQGSPAIPTSNCTRIGSEGSPPSPDSHPRNVTGKAFEVTFLGWCPHGSPKLPEDLWEMEKNFWKRSDRDGCGGFGAQPQGKDSQSKGEVSQPSAPSFPEPWLRSPRVG